MKQGSDTADICIVSTQHPARNPRVVKEADALTAAGLRVEVLTVASGAATLKADRALVSSRPWQLRYGVDLTGQAGGSRLKGLHLRLATRMASALNRRLGSQCVAALGPVRPLLRAALGRRAQLYIVHTDGGLWIGRELLRHGRRVAADFEDWHSQDLLPADRRRLPLKAMLDAEVELLRRAVLTTTTSQAMASAMQQASGGSRPLVVSNAFPLQADPRRGPAGSPPAFFWFSQTLGPGRGLESFLAAWALMREPSRCVLLGHPTPGYFDHLASLVPPNRRPALSWHEVVASAELPAVIARHDIGLALEISSIPNRDLTITNKILQYLNAGLAIVATPTAGQREVLAHRPDAGIFLPSGPSSPAADALDQLVGNPDQLGHRQHSARLLAEENYCWEKTAPLLVEAVMRALAPSTVRTRA